MSTSIIMLSFEFGAQSTLFVEYEAHMFHFVFRVKGYSLNDSETEIRNSRRWLNAKMRR